MAVSDITPYQILDVPENIEYATLRAVYRTKIHEHLQKKISTVKFRRMCRAYETLSDFNKRAHYDAQKEWIAELPLDRYTPQQLAAEPDLIRDLKQRLSSVTLTEINAQDLVTGHTTLYCAARAGNIEAVKFLTKKGAEPDLSQRTKSITLHDAAFYGHADVVRCLLENGADYRIVNSVGNTPEKEAYNDDVKRVFTELKQNAYVRVAANELDWFRNNKLTEHQDTEYFAQRQTLLHCASKKGYFDLVLWLVKQRSANPNLVDSNGNSALHLAAYGGHTTIVDYLLKRGCDSTLTNQWGTTAEEEGSKHGRKITDLFKYMRERDMFEMARDGIDWWFYYYFDHRSKDLIDSNGISLLYHACCFGQYSVAKWLLEHGANVNIQMTANPRSTPLHGAKFRGHLSVVELLLEYGADVNIKNDYKVTVFDEVFSGEVDKALSVKINEILQQYKRNLKTDKLIDIHVYNDDDTSEEPVAKLRLELEAKETDLLEALRDISGNQYSYFSVARRPLDFKEKETTIISAVCCARYTSSKFIDTPIRLIGHKTLPIRSENQQSTRKESKLNLHYFDQQLSNQGKVTLFSLKAPIQSKQNINVGNLVFTFSENCINDDIKLKVTALCSPNLQTFGLSGCICLFKIDLGRDISKLNELPMVSIVNEPHARLYTLATPAPYWFTSNTRRAHLTMISGIHAFIRYADIIPGQLTLPPDMFIGAALDKPLRSRNSPVPCTCLFLRERDTRTFPHIGYHGTNIKAIQSILLDGLVMPGTVVSCGKRINPPEQHFARNSAFFGLFDFGNAVFLSPSIHYSSKPVFAASFSHENRQLIPVLECSVKCDSYSSNRSTVSGYVNHPEDDINALDWRIKDPTSIEINAILFITKNKSIVSSKKGRMTTAPPSNGCFLS